MVKSSQNPYFLRYDIRINKRHVHKENEIVNVNK